MKICLCLLPSDFCLGSGGPGEFHAELLEREREEREQQ
jgi:hypothetical protein